MSYIIYRKSSNTNNFGQHKYTMLDLAARRHTEVVATGNWAVGSTVNVLMEHSLERVSGHMLEEQWKKVLVEVAHVAPAAVPAITKYFSDTFNSTLPPAPPKHHPRRKERMNPHRARLLRALKPHGAGYSTDYGRVQSAIEFDVSCYTSKDWGDYVEAYRENPDAPTPHDIDTLLPADDDWWDDAEQEFNTDTRRWGHITEDTADCFAHDDHYITNPVTGLRHDVEHVFAGRGGKHLLVTRFDGVDVKCALTETLRYSDNADLEHEGITNQWCRDLATMLEWWNALDVSKVVRQEYEYQEAYYVARIIEDELDERRAEAKRLRATDEWFAVSQ